MSRIGEKPIKVPTGVTVDLTAEKVTVKSSKGALSFALAKGIKLERKDDEIVVTTAQQDQQSRAMWGTTRSLLANMIQGVFEGFTKKLLIQGVGYRAQVQASTLKLALGFSHDVNYALPQDIKATCPSNTEILLHGIDKQKVGQAAAEIRAFRPPEPYKGKGIRYEGEYVRRKIGKKK